MTTLHLFARFSVALALAGFSGAALAQTPGQQTSAQKQWTKAIAAAQGQDLVVVTHPNLGFRPMVAAFQKRFPKIKVSLTSMGPEKFNVRALMEQRAGIYAWDTIVGPTSGMNVDLIPAGALAPIGDYVIFPELRNPATWRAPKYMYSTGKPVALNFSITTTQGIYYNKDQLKGLQITKALDLLSPQLKGRMVMRDPGGANAGSLVLASQLWSRGEKEGEIFVRRLLTEQNLRIISNPGQITDGVIRGNFAVALGAESDAVSKCQAAGGCRNVERAAFDLFGIARGVGVMKNAPHKDAAKVWVNWLLSKEGQEAYVTGWAQHNQTGAVSLRKDVAPVKQRFVSEPDYNNMEPMLITGTAGADAYISKAQRLYREIRSAPR